MLSGILAVSGFLSCGFLSGYRPGRPNTVYLYAELAVSSVAVAEASTHFA